MINIAKFIVVVILLGACHTRERPAEIDAGTAPFTSLEELGPLPVGIKESSGLAASQCQEDVFWTHNDSGDEPVIYAIDSKAKLLGVWRVDGAENFDWEDMSSRREADGRCWLYLGDIGNTNKRERKLHNIYRLEEPQLLRDRSNLEKTAALATTTAERLEFEYPDGRFDAEALLVHPTTGIIYVLTKEKSKQAAVYRLRPEFGIETLQTAVRVSEFSVPSIPGGFLTGASISPDGRNVAICDYAAGYEITLPAGAADFDEIWKQTPKAFPLGEREQGEAISYGRDAHTIYATSEKKGANLIRVHRAQAQ